MRAKIVIAILKAVDGSLFVCSEKLRKLPGISQPVCDKTGCVCWFLIPCTVRSVPSEV